MDSRNRINVQLRGEALTYFQARLNQWHSNEADLLNQLILEHKRLSEKAAEPAPPISSPLHSESAAPTEILKTGTQQPRQPDNRSFLEPSPAELTYMKEKKRQQARTEGMIERAKARAEIRAQAAADREEQEYYLWKKRQDEKDRLTYRGPKVYYPGVG